MKLSDLIIYPIKSLGGVHLKEALVFDKGLQFDRRWMLVDEHGKFISQRTEHKLALLHAHLSSDGIIINNSLHPNQSITIPYHSILTKAIPVTIWDDQTDGYTLDSKYADWFSSFLGKPCQLVFMAEDGLRPVDDRFAKNQEQVSFADAFPYLLIGEGSLSDLNSRLPEPVPMNRFRPNLVISGTKPFEEDTWDEIRIGEVRFQVAKPCARCVLITVDQQTAVKGKEPLATLARYRNMNNKVLFGQNLIALNEGILQVGDAVEVLKVKPS